MRIFLLACGATLLIAKQGLAQTGQIDNQYSNISWICGEGTGCQAPTYTPGEGQEPDEISFPAFIKPIRAEYFLSHHEPTLSLIPLPTDGDPSCAFNHPDADSDGDGFDDGIDNSQNAPPLLGPYQADGPLLLSDITSVTFSIPIFWVSRSKYETKTTTIGKNSYEREVTSSRMTEFRHALGFDIKSAFGLGNQSGWTFSLNASSDISAGTSETWKIEEKTKESISRSYEQIVNAEASNELIIDTSKPARISILVDITNVSRPLSTLRVNSLEFAIVSHDQAGTEQIWGASQIVVNRTYLPGETKWSLLQVDLDPLTGDVLRLINALRQGEVFFPKLLTSSLIDYHSGEDQTLRLEKILSRTAGFHVSWGPRDTSQRPRSYPRIALRRFGQQFCLTPRGMLETRFGSQGFDVANGQIVRILDKENVHADRPFDQLTEEEKDEFGKWVMAIRLYSESNRTDSPEININTALQQLDEVRFYYLRREDFETATIDFVDIEDDIGIIPDNWNDCPLPQQVQVRMDDEDSGTANTRWGWNGSIRSTKNTLFRFCRVDGKFFRNVVPRINKSRDEVYAVLRLGETCPVDSRPFERYFDNEDSNNDNWTLGNIWPNASNHQGTRLKFCLFRPFPDTPVSPFPDVGFPYGVFAAPEFFSEGRGIQSGGIFIDDEDSSNDNSLKHHRDDGYFVRGIVIPRESSCCSDGNTEIRMGRVR